MSASSYKYAEATNLTMTRGARRNVTFGVKSRSTRIPKELTERYGHRNKDCGPESHIAEKDDNLVDKIDTPEERVDDNPD